MVSLFPARQGRAGLRTITHVTATAAACAVLCPMHHRCVGCEKKAAPGGQERQIERSERWGNRRRRSRRRGAATANEWRSPRPAPQAVARSALPKAWAEVSALVRTPVQGVVHEPVRGAARTGEARGVPGTVGHGDRDLSTACPLLWQAERAVSVSERRREGLQRKSERSGDWSGKPGREAARPTWT